MKNHDTILINITKTSELQRWPVVDTFPIRARSLSSPIRYFPLILDSLCVSQVSQVELDKSNIGKTTLSALIEILKATFSYTATCWKLLALRPKRDGVLKQSSTSFWHCPYFQRSNMSRVVFECYFDQIWWQLQM